MARHLGAECFFFRDASEGVPLTFQVFCVLMTSFHIPDDVISTQGKKHIDRIKDGNEIVQLISTDFLE